MIKLNSTVTDKTNFYGNTDPASLIKEFGSPLYVYNEAIIRARAGEMRDLCSYKNFGVNYSAKANSNIALLQIVCDEGLDGEAMSPGEITAELMAGFKSENILCISNNISGEEMKFAADRGITVSVDSLSQLELFGKVNPGCKVAVRFNTGVGAGHHAKVVTGGSATKFGVNPELIPEVKDLVNKYNLKLVGINHHIGSLFMDPAPYLDAAKNLFDAAMSFEGLEFIDLGGGFGVPYKKQSGEERLDLKLLGAKLDGLIDGFIKNYGSEIVVKVEPGRYICAESGVLLGTVHTVKYNGPAKYIGTDIGMSVLLRPAMYDSHHDIEVYRESGSTDTEEEDVTVVGNICETGDIIAKKIRLPKIVEGDILGIQDAGAYGFVMSSNYNHRLRPAEVLIRKDGSPALIRERDTVEDLLKPYKKITL